jgi:hypothetical protein
VRAPGVYSRGVVDDSVNLYPPAGAGVQYVPPPPELAPGILASINAALADAPLTHGAIVAVGNDAGWNSAIVVKGPAGLRVTGWIGSRWDHIDRLGYGIHVTKTF